MAADSDVKARRSQLFAAVAGRSCCTWEAPPEDAASPIDVTFPGYGARDQLDESVSALASPFCRRT